MVVDVAASAGGTACGAGDGAGGWLERVLIAWGEIIGEVDDLADLEGFRFDVGVGGLDVVEGDSVFGGDCAEGIACLDLMLSCHDERACVRGRKRKLGS